MQRSIIAVIPAAGIGERMKAERPKQYLSILGKTILEHTLSTICSHPAIEQVILVVSASDPYIHDLTLPNNVQLVEGGKTRAESVLNGLYSIHDEQAWVLVHDAARPCLKHSDIDKLLSIKEEKGAILAVPVTDTLKRSSPTQQILCTEDRSQLWQALTPQFFPLKLLKEALSCALKKGATITDESSAMEYVGYQPHLVIGRSDNLKVTRPEDLALAEFYLMRNKK